MKLIKEETKKVKETEKIKNQKPPSIRTKKRATRLENIHKDYIMSVYRGKIAKDENRVVRAKAAYGKKDMEVLKDIYGEIKIK